LGERYAVPLFLMLKGGELGKERFFLKGDGMRSGLLIEREGGARERDAPLKEEKKRMKVVWKGKGV